MSILEVFFLPKRYEIILVRKCHNSFGIFLRDWKDVLEDILNLSKNFDMMNELLP